ncbi:kinase-like domain-containing protein [Rhizophagus irregularis DAOM 181602=DAOM 197198]|nr:kinase-like domain-containing protein [Rhizophagus irregularis DAOM 181602=DAOM 197198]
MDKIKHVFEQIKDFSRYYSTEKQKSLVGKEDNLCENCKQTDTAVWKDGPIRKWDYENNQWERNGETKVALKCLHNSQDITADFLKEVESNILVCESGLGLVVRCFGIAKNPKTNNFIMVMALKNCSLRQHINDNFNSLNWLKKLGLLRGISIGLRDIHNSGLIHHDLHCGNILVDVIGSVDVACITDLGLCQPANVKSSQSNSNEIYGVLPYVATEVLRGKEYTQASDIYAFGIIAYEICTGLPPYHDIPHDELLAMKICQGLRPKSNYIVPQLIIDIINQCWDTDPSKRPEVNKLFELQNDLWKDWIEEDSVIKKQINEADEINKKTSSTVQPHLSTIGTLSYTTHPQAIYISRLLDLNNLLEPKNADNNDDLFGIEYSESIRMDFTKLDINDESN